MKISSNADSTGGYSGNGDTFFNGYQSFSGKTSSTILRRRASIPAST